MYKAGLFILLIFFILVTSNTAYSQMKADRFLSLQLGVQKHREADNIISPFIYESAITPLAFSLTWEKTHFKHSINLETYSSILNASTGNTRKIHHFALGYGYQKKITPFPLFEIPVQLYAGSDWSNVVHINFQRFTNSNYSSNPSGYLSSVIRITGKLDFDLHPEHSIAYGLETPIIQYITRPGYSLFTPNEDPDDLLANLLDGSFEWFFQSLQLSQHIEYKFKVSGKFHLTATYHYNIYETPNPRTFSSIRHGFSFGTLIKW